jgi:hypothetical protein
MFFGCTDPYCTVRVQSWYAQTDLLANDFGQIN